MFVLKKLEIEKDEISMVPSGHTTRAPLPKLFHWKRPEEGQKQISSVGEVKVGYQLMLSSLTAYHVTSEIKEIVSVEPKRVVFKTQTSLYELKEE
jgi:hypothetical protein